MAVVTSGQLRDAAQGLADYAAAHGLTGADDRVWAYNAILECAGATGPAPAPGWVLGTPAPGDAFDLDATLAAISEAAVANGVADDTASGRDRASCRVMGLLMPRPSQVSARFHELAAHDPKAATDWFYQLCCDAGYVRRSAIARNVKWSTPTRWGDLEITINLSKPEKDPREIAAAGVAANDGEKYPACQLCIENEGYPGRAASAPGGAHPARQNLRPVKVEMNGSEWFLQYSPYGYYNEHCIVFNKNHVPMVIDDSVFDKLFDFIEQFPHYMLGSNADLPIVGGSILTHEHFQGGRYTFPMARASVEKPFLLSNHSDVSAGIVKWPMSVIRLSSYNRASLSAACAEVLKKWRAYTDEQAGIFAQTDGVPHNTITPIARMNGSQYECDLVLRNNITSEDRPLGIFHPAPALHHIKKENIGLIEVMGLAVLPARLATELSILRDAMLSGADIAADERIASHADWAKEVLAAHPEFNADNAMDIIHAEVGKVFGQVLEDAGVFKRTESGKEAFKRFVSTL